KLPAFRRIDPMQPDALPSNFQCVAVDHAGDACQTIGMGLGDGKKGEQKESEKKAHRANLSWNTLQDIGGRSCREHPSLVKRCRYAAFAARISSVSSSAR